MLRESEVKSRIEVAEATGLTPLTNSGTAANVIFNLPTGINAATLANAAGSQLILSGSPVLFEATTFNNPTNALTINAGSIQDTLAISGPSNLTAGLTVGSIGSPFTAVSLNGSLTLSTGTAALAAS